MCLQVCSARTIPTRVSCSEGTDTVAGIGRYAGQYWPLIGWAGSHVAGLCALIGCWYPGGGGDTGCHSVWGRLSGHHQYCHYSSTLVLSSTLPLHSTLLYAILSLSLSLCTSTFFEIISGDIKQRSVGYLISFKWICILYCPLLIPGTIFK